MRELRNNTRAVLDRVDAGETIVITVDGREVAELRPIERRAKWMSRAEFVRRFSGRQADPDLARGVARVAPDTTDDLDPL